MRTLERTNGSLAAGGLFTLLLAPLSFSLSLPGCASGSAAPELGGLYNREAQYHGEERNPVIVIPGILGSRLEDAESGRVIWGAFAGDFVDPGLPAGARQVAIPMREGAPLAELADGAVPAGVLDSFRVSLLGLPIEQRAYINILQSLGAGGYRDEEIGRAAIDYGGGHFTCFQFPYDWRRDNIENARKLHEFILEKKAYVESVMRKELGIENPVAKFDIVAHSMGGLVTRYYLRYGAQDLREDGSPPELTWAGAEHVERAILVGTPNAGSVYALIQLIEGIRFAPLLPSYGPGILGTMTAIYELMPRARHGALVDLEDRSVKLDPFDPALWERLGWGLASPRNDEELKALLPEAPDAAARRRIALDHLRKCLERARGFNEALDRPARPPEGLELCLFAGDAVPTPAVLGVDQKTGAVRVLETAPGDGTVPRTSALMDERVGSEWRPSLVSPVDWSRVTFLFTDHLGMTGDPAFTDNVLYLLLEDPR